MLELAHFNRFSTAGELASSIAHEINQPLGAILTNTETARLMVKSQSPDLDETEKILADIERDNRRASEVIRRLRSYVTKVPFEIKEFDLNGQVAETLDFLSPQARSRNIVLRSELTGTPLQIKGDSIQLQQVLSNLILNAMDAVSESASARREVIVTTARKEKFVKVSVADTGPGIPPEAMKTIFEPFFSTKKHGMGMGLSIARTIVAAHDGLIEVGEPERRSLPNTTSVGLSGLCRRMRRARSHGDAPPPTDTIVQTPSGFDERHARQPMIPGTMSSRTMSLDAIEKMRSL